MQFNTTCPACGSQLSLDTSETTATCPFCGTTYQVDFSQTEPVLTAIRPGEMTPEPLPAQSAETESAEPEPPPPVFEPAVQYEAPPPPMQAEVVTPNAPKRNTTWILVAIGVIAVVCALCVCMALASVVWNIRVQ